MWYLFCISCCLKHMVTDDIADAMEYALGAPPHVQVRLFANEKQLILIVRGNKPNGRRVY